MWRVLDWRKIPDENCPKCFVDCQQEVGDNFSQCCWFFFSFNEKTKSHSCLLHGCDGWSLSEPCDINQHWGLVRAAGLSSLPLLQSLTVLHVWWPSCSRCVCVRGSVWVVSYSSKSRVTGPASSSGAEVVLCLTRLPQPRPPADSTGFSSLCQQVTCTSVSHEDLMRHHMRSEEKKNKTGVKGNIEKVLTET